jgi:hypothetical protein
MDSNTYSIGVFDEVTELAGGSTGWPPETWTG